MKLVACVISFFLILAACVASAQSTGTNPGVGFPSFGSFAGSEFDTVNEGNLDIHFSIPVLQKSGRGVAVTGKIVYDSLIWSAVGAPLDINGNRTGPAVWAPPTLTPWGWYFTPVAGYVTFSQAQTPPTCPNHSGIWIRSNYTYHAADGTGHSIQSGTQAVPADCYGVGYGFTSQFTQDNSGYSISVDSAMNVSVTTVGGVLIHPALNMG